MSGRRRAQGWLTRTWLAGATAAIALAAGCGDSEDDPAGTRNLVVYEASAGGVTNIYTIDPVTAESRQLTFGDNFDGNPAWSPDGSRIVFASKRDGQSRNDIYVMDADGGNVRRLGDTPDGGELSPRFSPDGERIAYVSEFSEGWSVWEMSADGTGARRLAGTYAFAEFPAWSADADEIFFAAIEQNDDQSRSASNRYEEESSANTAHIYSVDLGTLEVRTRIRTAGIDVCPHVTPDGEYLLYASTRTADNAVHQIYIHDLSSTDTSGESDTALTAGDARSDYPDPSPDGRSIVFTSDRDGNTEMYVMNADGTGQRRLTHTEDLRENVPDW